MEGLALGFGLAYLSVFHADLLARQARWAPSVFVACVLALVPLAVVGRTTKYVLWHLLVSLGLSAVLLFAYFAKSAPRFWRPVALASYSIYLTHPLAIHVARRATEALGEAWWPVYYPLVFILIGGTGTAFYLAVERTSIALRDAWVPRRGAAASDRSLRRA